MSIDAVIKCLAATPMSTRQLQAALSASLPKPLTEQIILGLQAKGLVAAVRGGKWQLTARGYERLPRVVPDGQMRPYQPPRVVRRAGSDRAMRLPSVMAGKVQ